jgi:hypothetical protein
MNGVQGLERRVYDLERRVDPKEREGIPAPMGPGEERLYRLFAQIILENEPTLAIRERLRVQLHALLLRHRVDLDQPGPEGAEVEWCAEDRSGDLQGEIIQIIMENEPDPDVRHRMAVVLEEVTPDE